MKNYTAFFNAILDTFIRRTKIKNEKKKQHNLQKSFFQTMKHIARKRILYTYNNRYLGITFISN